LADSSFKIMKFMIFLVVRSKESGAVIGLEEPTALPHARYGLSFPSTMRHLEADTMRLQGTLKLQSVENS
jgi:hypothetical protein